MSESIKETALSMALTATRELPLPDPGQTVAAARTFEAYLLESVGDQTLIERDKARGRVVALEQELAATTNQLRYARRHAMEAVLKQAREGCEGLDRLLVESTVEVAAKIIGVDL